MSDEKIKDKVEQSPGLGLEKPAINIPEGQQVRNATGDQVEAIKASNPDRHDGSATPKNRRELYTQAIQAGQDKSLEIYDDGKQQVIAARVMPEATSVLPQNAIIPNRETRNDRTVQSGTVTEYTTVKTGYKSFSLGLDYEETPNTKTPVEKLLDFMQASGKRATDPEGWKAWAQSEITKLSGTGAGLNDAKVETKTAVAAGWKAMRDGTVVEFLSHPSAINDPVFRTVANAFDAMSKDPNATNQALEALGKIVLKASEEYGNLPDYQKGKVIGKAMFGLVNPEGSTEAADAALNVADQIATHVDKVVTDTIKQSLDAVKNAAKGSPEIAQQTKQMLYDYIKRKGLTGPQLEYAGIPKDYFDSIERPKGDGREEQFFAMSKSDELGKGHIPKLDGGMERDTTELSLSEGFESTINKTIENLSDSQKGFLRLHDIKIKPIPRIADKFPNSEQRAACFDPSERSIYVAEYVLKLGKWVPNEDLEFALRHEIGHAFNAKSHPFGEWHSQAKGFREAFKEDVKAIPSEKLKELQLSYDRIELLRDEVFSDMYGHATGATSGVESRNPRSIQMKELFQRCLKYVQNLRLDQ